jgi:hypothetical protein
MPKHTTMCAMDSPPDLHPRAVACLALLEEAACCGNCSALAEVALLCLSPVQLS